MRVDSFAQSCHPERSDEGAKPKDLRITCRFAVKSVRRFFDSLALAQNDSKSYTNDPLVGEGFTPPATVDINRSTMVGCKGGSVSCCGTRHSRRRERHPRLRSVCGTRQFPCQQWLRHLPTTAHSAPSLYLPPAALRLEAAATRSCRLIRLSRRSHRSPSPTMDCPLYEYSPIN